MKQKNKLSFQVFLYSIIVSILVALIIILYFVYLLPGIYAKDRQEKALNQVVKVQKGFVKDFKQNQNISTSFYSFKLNEDSSIVEMNSNITSHLTIKIKDNDIKQTISYLQRVVKDEKSTFRDIEKINFSSFKKMMPKEIEIDLSEKKDKNSKKGNILLHKKEDVIVIETITSTKEDHLTNYFSISQSEDGLIVTIFPLMVSKFTNLSTSIVSILPAIVLIISIVVIVLATIFSKRIIKPIDRLVKHAQKLKNNYHNFEPINIDDNDRMHILSEVLNELHYNLVYSINEVEAQNKIIQEEKERQNIFLMASSHQLKTPVAAALLVVEGMIDNLGKYQVHKDYLPVVKKELLSMNEIIHEIIEINSHDLMDVDYETVNLNYVVDSCLNNYGYIIDQKGLKIVKDNIDLEILSNEVFINKIIDNIINNAVKYSTDGSEITIKYEDKIIEIYNQGNKIEEELLKHIYEPFIRSINSTHDGHGLGLYIVQSYAQRLNIKVEISNTLTGVCAKIYL